MHYKTIVLELLQQRPAIYEPLRSRRMLLPAVERLASELKAGHEAWKESLTQERPGSPSQIASEALELALQELEGSLPPASSPAEDDPLSFDAAMAFLRRPTPSA
jgi:hypothetical protein